MMQAVILAGGLGTRLRPITEKIPKPMVSVLGRPYLEYQIKWLRLNGIKKILLLTGYLGEKIEEYFGNGGLFGVKISYSKEPEALGTGGSIRFSSDKLESSFILIYGDSFLPMSFPRFINFFYDSGKKGMVVVYSNNKHDSRVLNNILLDEKGLVLKYKKNSKDKDLNFVEAGVMIFKKEVLDLIPASKKVSLEDEVFPVLIKDRELAGYVSKKMFYDIGTEKRLEVFEEAVRSNIFGLNKI